jgi:hypothetical protein
MNAHTIRERERERDYRDSIKTQSQIGAVRALLALPYVNYVYIQIHNAIIIEKKIQFLMVILPLMQPL